MHTVHLGLCVIFVSKITVDSTSAHNKFSLILSLVVINLIPLNLCADSHRVLIKKKQPTHLYTVHQCILHQHTQTQTRTLERRTVT